MNTTADSLASGALGVALTALAWLIAHSAQIKRVLDLLPTIATDAAKARAAVESSGIGPAVTHVRTEVTGDIEAVVRKVMQEMGLVADDAGQVPHPPSASAPAPSAPTQPAA
jgi:hypothetical protein